MDRENNEESSDKNYKAILQEEEPCLQSPENPAVFL